ncbi:hypothetical protein ACFFGH_23120 [Lysobacter korlensis]|uniref:Transcriptional regulator, AbiEi antitoxin, Type IV TA system n=1 Tax=Lysobacter korlensis TaxID=553636 RepID=A0ABV6RUT4_9GAMM
MEHVAGADPLSTTRHYVAVGADDRALRRSHQSGALVRVRRGAYAATSEWALLRDDERYDLRIAAVLATRRSEVVLSHHSAARLWGLPLIDWPSVVHITEPLDSRRRSKNGVAVHRRDLDASSVTVLGDVRVTTLIRTLIDLACDAAFRDAVAAIDCARSRYGEALSLEVLLRALDFFGSRNTSRARRATEFSTDLAMSPLESFSRVVIAELGFPEPVLQHVVRTRRGRRLTDFWWPAERVMGECDGKVKYEDVRFLAGRSAADVVWDEKLRENELSDDGVRFARWTWSECAEPWRLATRLRAAGLRQSPTAPRVKVN